LEILKSEVKTDLDFQLLTDAKGVYGFGFRSKSHQQNENLLKFAPDIVLRRDLIEPLTHGEHTNFVFLALYNTNLSEWISNRKFLESIFSHIQTAVIAQRNGVIGNCLSFLLDGTEPEAWEPFPDEFEAYSKEAIAQVEKVISSAYASCVPPDVMPVLGQLPINWRYRAYTHMVDSPRFTQLLSEFPVLAFKLMSLVASDDLPEGTRTRAKAMVEDGHKLRKIADFMQVAYAMRRVSFQEADSPFPMQDNFCNYNSHLQNYWDRNAESVAGWLWNINLAHMTSPEFAEWMVCNNHECNSKFDVLKIGDWVRASLEGTSISPVTRPFEKTMSARTVERLSEEWHKNMEGAYNAILGIKRPDYWTGCPEANGCETEEEYIKIIREKIAAKTLPKAWVGDAEINGIAIKAATNELKLIEASLYLKNCGGTYSDRIHKGECCIYTATRGAEFLAMIEVKRHLRGFHVTQCAGYLNQPPPTDVLEAVKGWELTFPTSPEPTWEEIYSSDNWELEIVPPALEE
jgi:hypothetical protein